MTIEFPRLRETLRPATRISLTPDGFLRASDRGEGAGDDPTNYHAVWVRDSIWAYLGLKADPGEGHRAVRVLEGLLRYFATSAQRARLNRLIARPELARDPVEGAMAVPHIRFDPASADLDDVFVKGRPQHWNHKQNDALGLFYDFTLRALGDRSLDPATLTDGQWEVLLRLPAYFEATGFWDFPEAGAWEEIDRINSSSVALVTSALETLQRIGEDGELRNSFQSAAHRLGLDPAREPLLAGRIGSLVDRGYERLLRQLPFESPDHPKDSPYYREADAALLSVLYPARLDRLTAELKRRTLEVVGRLVREKGTLRYEGDSYQGGNYWLAPQPEDTEVDSRTDDCSGAAAFAARASRLIPGTEAQWFFDSWISKCEGLLYRETANAAHHDRQIRFFHRALAQLTDGTPGADGRPVAPFQLPESYNTLVDDQGRKRLAPSPITPLNWAKCSLLVALDELERNAAT